MRSDAALSGYAGQLEPHYAALGAHFEAAEQWSDAVDYLGLAARQAAERWAYRDAVSMVGRALGALDHVPESPKRIEQELDLRLQRMHAGGGLTLEHGDPANATRAEQYLSRRVYYLYGPSVKVVTAWEPYVGNFAPNNGPDIGGRLMAAWLDR